MSSAKFAAILCQPQCVKHTETALPNPARHVASFPACDQLPHDTFVPGLKGANSRQSPPVSHHWTETMKNLSLERIISQIYKS